ncbi:unnamed protein product [Camellia sinensis]
MRLQGDRTKYYLLASLVLHIKHSSEIYQEKLSKALAHHFGAKLLVFHSRLYPSVVLVLVPSRGFMVEVKGMEVVHLISTKAVGPVGEESHPMANKILTKVLGGL